VIQWFADRRRQKSPAIAVLAERVSANIGNGEDDAEKETALGTKDERIQREELPNT
jgi:hypothetical protein